MATNLQDIEKGHHDDKECEKYRQYYKIDFDQDLPDCEYKGNKSKIQKLIRKAQIDANGIVTEIEFDNKKNDEEMNVSKGKIKTKSEGSKSLGTKLKNLFQRK